MKRSVYPWQRFWHPLIEEPWPETGTPKMQPMGMTRGDCERWLWKLGFTGVPRSSCVFCPFHSDREWRAVREVPDDWKLAVKVDAALRSSPDGKLKGMKAPVFVHRSLLPLPQVNLDHAHDEGLWADECAGVCGV